MIEGNFEWDDEKAASNLTKHKVCFEQAKGVFRDPFAIEFLDDSQDYGEERYVLIGMSAGRIIAVVYTERNEHTRIISARKADPNDKRRYHEENS